MDWHRLDRHLKGTRLWRLLFLGLAILGLCVLLPSCSPLERLRLENFRVEAADVPQLVSPVVGEPKTFNYFLSDESSSSDVLGFMYEGLITVDRTNSEILPALADSWTIAEDGLTITYLLKENLKWSDGEPLTVDDVVFTYNDIILNPEIPTDTIDILRIGAEGKLPEVTKIDERQVQFKIPEPFAPFLRVTGIAILPKHALEESVRTKDSNGQPLYLSKWGTNTDPSEIVCNGPYVIKNFLPGERIVFKRNPYYWRTGENGQPQPLIEEMVWPVVSSQDAQFVRFRSGEADIMAVTPDNFSLIKQDEEQGGYTVYNGGPTTTRLFLTFNLNKGAIDGEPVVDPIKSKWFNTLAFRQAVAYAIDRETMLNNIFKGLGEMQNSQIAPQSPYSAEPNLISYDFNINKAKELLLSAGFSYEGDQLVDADGNQVRFTLQTNVGNEIREAAGAQIKQNLALIGITVDFQPIDFNKLITLVGDSLQWDAIVLGFGAGEEPNSSANLWLADGGLHLFNQQPQGQPPLPGREVYPWEQQISDLYIQAAQELDETKRKALYTKTQELVQENLPFIHLVGQYSMSAVRDKIENVKYTALGGTLWNIYELEITQN
ncbi:Bacterial extracellular solute-binding protein, family 5 [Synechococcus sp. PCC 7335]|uniref:ABC transporter substrate-binding protein n=1 Tax=Synechococcus sp. (strain ATCC 29403 / PCC 7335) TaxID=91464 RepID=UPI00017EB0E4|nr:ABC transporter substrate-binding protein [Synechococcus sp. PCC 7335]EDX87159.1 Bacterial extracellular solute-binding protein, family 5 [Synechococcus sp. PCC 7335]